MNRLKNYLDYQVLRSHTNLAIAYSNLQTLDNCFSEMNLYLKSEPLSMSVESALTLVEEALELSQDFLKSNL